MIKTLRDKTQILFLKWLVVHTKVVHVRKGEAFEVSLEDRINMAICVESLYYTQLDAPVFNRLREVFSEDFKTYIQYYMESDWDLITLVDSSYRKELDELQKTQEWNILSY